MNQDLYGHFNIAFADLILSLLTGASDATASLDIWFLGKDSVGYFLLVLVVVSSVSTIIQNPRSGYQPKYNKH